MIDDLQTVKTILDTEIRRIFGALIQNGYEFQGCNSTSTKALGQYLEAWLIHSKLPRKIRVSYLPPIPPRLEVITVFIKDNGNDSFSVDEYLEHNKASAEEIDATNITLYPGSLNDRISACLSSTKVLMDKYLSKVLSGEEWTHIPIDWGNNR